MLKNPRRIRRALLTGAVVTGAGLGAAGVASAATGTTASTANGTSSATGTEAPASPGNGHAPPAGGPVGNPATVAHGPGETLLSGADLQKATAAATAAVPSATIVRAETDSSGASTYEVHLKKSDRTYVTVELDSSFNVVRTVSGFGAGPANGQRPPNGSNPPANGQHPPLNGSNPPAAA